jgi:hypothetical protein
LVKENDGAVAVGQQKGDVSLLLVVVQGDMRSKE